MVSVPSWEISGVALAQLAPLHSGQNGSKSSVKSPNFKEDLTPLNDSLESKNLKTATHNRPLPPQKFSLARMQYFSIYSTS